MHLGLLSIWKFPATSTKKTHMKNYYIMNCLISSTLYPHQILVGSVFDIDFFLNHPNNSNKSSSGIRSKQKTSTAKVVRIGRITWSCMSCMEHLEGFPDYRIHQNSQVVVIERDSWIPPSKWWALALFISTTEIGPVTTSFWGFFAPERSKLRTVR